MFSFQSLHVHLNTGRFGQACFPISAVEVPNSRQVYIGRGHAVTIKFKFTFHVTSNVNLRIVFTCESVTRNPNKLADVLLQRPFQGLSVYCKTPARFSNTFDTILNNFLHFTFHIFPFTTMVT